METIKTVLVFKTNVARKKDLKVLKPALENKPDVLKWNVDLDDHEKVLRIETTALKPQNVEHLLAELGFTCLELKD